MERKYEACFILNADMKEEDVEKEAGFIEQKIIDAGAAIKKKELWGKKNFAYPIEKKKEGVYYLFYFTATPDKIALINQPLKLRENILRSLIIQKKSLPEEKKTIEEPATESANE